MADKILTAERLRELFHYDAEHGLFTNLKTGVTSFEMRCGKGGTSIYIDGKSYLAHRLAWLYVTGAWPDRVVRQRNGLVFDFRWANINHGSIA